MGREGREVHPRFVESCLFQPPTHPSHKADTLPQLSHLQKRVDCRFIYVNMHASDTTCN